MIKYEEVIDFLIEVGRRHPNIEYVQFGQDIIMFNDDSFRLPALMISPTNITFNDNSRMIYSFNITYLDKLKEEKNHVKKIMEDTTQIIMGYLAVIDLTYKIIYPFDMTPILTDYDGGYIVGGQVNILIEDIYNLEKYKSVFYG